MAPVLLLALSSMLFNQSSACTVHLGKRMCDMEISPKVPLFSEEDGCFYPGGPRITKYLEVKNVGRLPFRICMLSATLHENVALATGLRIEVLEFGSPLYEGTLSDLARGAEVNGSIIPPGRSITLQLTVWMPETAGNEYQGLRLAADLSITVCSIAVCKGGRC